MTATEQARVLLLRLAADLESGERAHCRRRIRRRLTAVAGPTYARCAVGHIQDGVSLETDFNKPVYPGQLRQWELRKADEKKLAVARAAERLVARALGKSVLNRHPVDIELEVIYWADGYSLKGAPTSKADIIRVFRRAARLS